MQESLPGTLKFWERFTSTIPPAGGLPAGISLSPPFSREQASRLYYTEAMEPLPARPIDVQELTPYTLQWFLAIENQRYRRHARWIPRVLEFAKHSGETLLGLGDGLGTDWLQYARNGASVVVCSPSSEQLQLVRRNFDLRGLAGRFVHALPNSLPLENATIDVACVSGLLEDEASLPAVIHEIYRVLKPGGKVLAVTPAKYDVTFWKRIVFPWIHWLQGNIEPRNPGSIFYSRRRLIKLFHAFDEHRVYKRHLQRSLVPHIWRWLPSSFLQRVMGQALVLKAFKPIRASANAISLAA